MINSMGAMYRKIQRITVKVQITLFANFCTLSEHHVYARCGPHAIAHCYGRVLDNSMDHAAI